MKRPTGFTLIELLVVIAIMTTVLSLVAPLMIKQVDKTKAAAEYYEVEQYLLDSTKVAFLKGQRVSFTFDGKSLRRIMGPDVIVLEFEHLFFPKQSMQISANGFASIQYISVISGNKSQQIDLSESM